MTWDLLPMSNGGELFNVNSIFDTTKNGKIAALQFINRGTNSTAVIKFGGIIFEIAPTESEEVTMQPFGFDTTMYTIEFRKINPALSSNNKLLVLTQKYI